MDTQPTPVLDSLELTVVVDNETDALSRIDAGVDQISEIASLLAPEPTIEELVRAGGQIVFNDQAHAVAGLFVGSGQIDRVTAYETGLAGHHTWRGDVVEADPLIMDERFLAAHVRGRGVSVLSACSHAGVVNACLGAKALFPDTPVDVVLGGYHLAGGLMEARIPDTVRDLLSLIDPKIVAPGHCTGWRAKAALAEAFSPGRFGPSVVGSRYNLMAKSGPRSQILATTMVATCDMLANRLPRPRPCRCPHRPVEVTTGVRGDNRRVNSQVRTTNAAEAQSTVSRPPQR